MHGRMQNLGQFALGCEVKAGMAKQSEWKRRQKEARTCLKEIAMARVNDVVKLAYLEPEQLQEIDTLDLTALCEFKRSGNGTVELKLLDRISALQKWMEWNGQEEEGQTAQALIEALGMEPEKGGGEQA